MQESPQKTKEWTNGAVVDTRCHGNKESYKQSSVFHITFTSHDTKDMIIESWYSVAFSQQASNGCCYFGGVHTIGKLYITDTLPSAS